MSNLNEQEIKKLREVPIVALCGLGTSIQRRVSIRCPFHRERTPSCVIYVDNSFHCFACQAHGKGAIDFLIKMGATFQEACEELKQYV